MDNTINAAISDLNHARDQMIRAISRTPKDRLSWSPSPTARTTIQIVAHSAFALSFICDMLQGTPYSAGTTDVADLEFLEMEKGVQTVDEALSLLEVNSARYAAFLGSLSDDRLNDMIVLPFGLGSAPLGAILTVGASHTRTHTAQIEYIQTIYGDRVW